MASIKFSDEPLADAILSLEKTDKHLESARNQTNKLISAIKEERIWTGESQLALLSYLDLLKQYLDSLVGEGTLTAESPLSEAVKALRKLQVDLERFYGNSSAYVRLEAL